MISDMYMIFYICVYVYVRVQPTDHYLKLVVTYAKFEKGIALKYSFVP